MPDIMRIRTTITGLQGLPGVYTVYALGTSSSPTVTDCQDVANRVRVFLNTIRAVWPSSITLQVLGDVDILADGSGQLQTSVSVTPPASVAGGTGGGLPAANAVLLRLETGQTINGRRIRGRSFLSPCNAGTATSALVDTTLRATIVSAALVTLTGTTSSVPCVWHRPKLPGPIGGSAWPITGFSVNQQYAVLRSRRD